jgi:hypothetical protein
MVQNKHRTKRFHPPTVREAKSKFENYGIITQYHGGASRHCTVQAYDKEEQTVIEFKQVRMKGSITNSKCKQRITIGSYVLLEYGEIALIYKDDQLIPSDILTALNNAAGVVEAFSRGMKAEEDDESEDHDTEDEEEECEFSAENSNPDLI